MRRVVVASVALAACGSPAPGAQHVEVKPTPSASTASPSRSVPVTPVEKVRASFDGVCALAGEHLACATSEDPILRSELADVTDFDAGQSHRCIVLRTGAVRCRGSNRSGEIGAGIETEVLDRWVDVPLPTKASRVAVADGISCVLDVKGDVWCWGDNAEGQTGGPDHYVSALRGHVRPSRVPLPRPMTSVAVTRSRACANDEAGVVCWGERKPPHALAIEAPPSNVMAAQERLYVAMRSGEVLALDGATTRRLDLLRGAVSLAADGGPTCGVTREGRLVCDGDRRRIDQDPANGYLVQALASIRSKSAVAFVRDLVFVLASDGTVYVTGTNPFMKALGKVAAGQDEPVPLGDVRRAPPP